VGEVFRAADIVTEDSVVNVIVPEEMNHRQFNDFLSDTEPEYGSVLYYAEVRWVSRGWMLKRAYDLKSETELVVVLVT
jgi:hypothetical protein